jgi:HSP20 family molecular chaperone IbpA
MTVERVSDGGASFEQGQRLAERKRNVEDEETALIAQKGQVEAQRLRMLNAEQGKTDDALVRISKEGEAQAAQLRKANMNRIQDITKANQDHFDALAANTSKRLSELDTQGLQTISNHRLAQTEKLAFVDKQAEDPFYHLSSFNAALSESDKEYQVKVALPPHEAKNLFLAAEGKTLRLSLARSFQDSEKTSPNTQTKSSSYQTILESIQTPGAFDPKQIRREYADGILTVFLPKV